MREWGCQTNTILSARRPTTRNTSQQVVRCIAKAPKITSTKLLGRQNWRFPKLIHEKILLRSITAINLGQNARIVGLDTAPCYPRSSIEEVSQKVAGVPTAHPKNVTDAAVNWPEPGTRCGGIRLHTIGAKLFCPSYTRSTCHCALDVPAWTSLRGERSTTRSKLCGKRGIHAWSVWILYNPLLPSRIEQRCCRKCRGA